MDEYDITTDDWADWIQSGYLNPSYTQFIPPKSPFSSQEDSNRKRRRSIVDDNNDIPQLLPQCLSPYEQPSRKRRRSVIGNNDDSSQLLTQYIASPHEQRNHKRRRLVVDNNNDSFLQSLANSHEQQNHEHRRLVADNNNHSPQPFLKSPSLPNEKPKCQSPPEIFVNKDDDKVEAHERIDESETLFSDWLAAFSATSAGNSQAAPQTLLSPTVARQNDLALLQHNLAGNRIEANTKAAEEGKWCCTICGKGPFKGKTGWQKHEKQHFPTYTAYCQPDIRTNGLIIYCSVCNKHNPTCPHASIPRGAICLIKSLSDRRYLTKESFADHLQTEHSLPSDCREVQEWERPPPKSVWACGFCQDQHYNGIEDRWRHIARHYNGNFTIADWNHSAVTFKLLGQSFVATNWFEHCRMMFSPETHPGKWPVILWSDDEAKALRERLNAGKEEDGKKLAEDAFNASQIGKQMRWRRQEQQQQQQPLCFQ